MAGEAGSELELESFQSFAQSSRINVRSFDGTAAARSKVRRT